MKLIFIKILILLFVLQAYPQELIWHHLGGPMGGTIGDIAINSKGHLYAGVYTSVFTSQTYEGIYKSTDNGDSWFKLENTVDQFEVYAIYINKQDHIFVGTNYRDRLYRSTDDGETWEIINNGYNTAECWAIGENKDGTVMFAGDGQFGRLYRSTNYGESWELSANLPVLAFAVDSSNNVYCGTHIGLYKSTDDGITWNQVGFNNIAVNTILIGNGDTVFCGTGYYDNGQGVFFSADTGANWTNIGLSDKIVFSLAFTSYGSLLAGTNIDGVYETSDFGATWVQHSTGLYKKQVFRLKVNNSNDIFVGSETEGVFRSTNSGESFKQVGLPISGIYNIDFMEDSLIIAATVSGVQKYNRFNGEWENIGQHAVLAVETDENGNIYAATNGDGLFQSSDMGKNWVNICQSPYILNVKKINNTILAATDIGLIRSTNNGNIWEDTPVQSGVDNCAIELNNNGDLWIAGFQKLFKSTDNGLTFESTTLSFRYISINNLLVNNTLIYFGDLRIGNGIHYSTDYGNTWENNFFHRGNICVSGSNNYVVFANDDNLLFTMDNGITWDSIFYPQNFYGWVKEIEFDQKGQMYFGTSSQGLYEINLVMNVNDDNSQVENLILYPPYPNPFNSTIIVKFNMPSPSDIKIVVYNILGQKIKTINLFAEKGINEQKLSFDFLTGGIYLIAVQGKGFYAVQKAAFVK